MQWHSTRVDFWCLLVVLVNNERNFRIGKYGPHHMSLLAGDDEHPLNDVPIFHPRL